MNELLRSVKIVKFEQIIGIRLFDISTVNYCYKKALEMERILIETSKERFVINMKLSWARIDAGADVRNDEESLP